MPLWPNCFMPCRCHIRGRAGRCESKHTFSVIAGSKTQQASHELSRLTIRLPLLVWDHAMQASERANRSISQRGPLTAEQKKRRVVLKRVNTDRSLVR